MLVVLRNSWPLLLGVMLLMVGNGIQGTLLGVRGDLEGFGTYAMSAVMSAYFVGFLFGSRMVPAMIRRVGHVRVFAALGSMISAVLILYPALPEWWLWALMRVAIGFSFSGVYITAESWLNAATDNDTRGRTMGAYMIVQMVGIIGGQVLLNAGDPSGYVLFVIPSVLVSLAFTPILLTKTPVPVFETTAPMSFRALFAASPLGCVGMFLMGGVFSALFGMVGVWATQSGLSLRDMSIFVAGIYLGGLVFQYPIGWVSDRMDRRGLIIIMALVGALACALAAFVTAFWPLVALGFIAGGIANPLYALLLAYTNDFLDNSRMAAASAGLLFINGLGAISGPPVTGWLMEQIGGAGFFVYLTVLNLGIAGYVIWRMRAGRHALETSAYAMVSPNASSLEVEAALESWQAKP